MKKVWPVMVVLILGFVVRGLESEDSDEEKHQQLQRSGHSGHGYGYGYGYGYEYGYGFASLPIHDEMLDTHENASGNEYAMNNGAEAGLGQHDVCSCSGCVCGALDRDANCA
ncbi:hypothetical protein EON63_04600 [archaeon]|nr:MAG: hypothetical protein EON63_04600 [archaeon]